MRTRKLSVIVPTYNRSSSLRKTLASLATASLPSNFLVEVIVVDNNSTDDTSGVIAEMSLYFGEIRLDCLFESRQGRSFAVNKGIRASEGDLISMIDDDAQISENWYIEVEKLFQDRWDELDFVGGKILPNLEVTPPSWVEPLKSGALCWRDFGDDEFTYTLDTPTITGTHGIFKQSVFDKVSLYNEHLGVKGKGFLGGEDEVLYDQLISHGCRGIYYPRLVVYHDVPARRLTKGFYRGWMMGVGRSRRIADLHYKRMEGRRTLEIPRWIFRAAAKGGFQKLKFLVIRNETAALEAEMWPLIFLGFLYQAHFVDRWFDRMVLKVLSGVAGKISR
jgi:glycosyltransferase involved in cell wall biosynthesis